MRIGSLFSGAGGLDMAVQQVFGGNIAWHCENDTAASKVLAHHWPETPNHGDITDLCSRLEGSNWLARSVDDVSDPYGKARFEARYAVVASPRPAIQPVDVLCGGWPCQPFSPAGKRKGINDERALWPHVARAIRALRPRYVVLENVAAVLRSPEFDRVTNSLAANGYEFTWTCLRASDVGAPHRRERLFIVAHTSGERLQGSWPGGDASEQSEYVCDSGPATDASGDRCGGDAQRHSSKAQSELTAPQRHDVNRRGDRSVELLPTPAAADGARGQDFARANRDGSGGDDLVTLAVKATNANQWGKYAEAIGRWEQIAGPAPSPTEPNSRGNPRLAPAFSEWMLGWPAGHVTAVPGISRNDQLRIIGNGVVPQQAEAALRYLLSVAEVAA